MKHIADGATGLKLVGLGTQLSVATTVRVADVGTIEVEVTSRRSHRLPADIPMHIDDSGVLVIGELAPQPGGIRPLPKALQYDPLDEMVISVPRGMQVTISGGSVTVEGLSGHLSFSQD